MRNVAGDVFWRKGHIERDWRRRASIFSFFVTISCGLFLVLWNLRVEGWEKRVGGMEEAVDDVCNIADRNWWLRIFSMPAGTSRTEADQLNVH